MSEVRLEFLSSLTETIGIAGKSGVVIDQEIEGDKTVRYLLNKLALKYRRFGQVVYDVNEQRLTENVSIFLNDCPLELISGLETKLNEGDTLTFLPPMAGG